MVAIDFPANPTSGQKFTTASGFIYTWNGSAWVSNASALPASYVLPAATAAALGGVKANAGTTGQVVTGIAADGSLVYGQGSSMKAIVSTTDPDPAQGNDGDLWIKVI